MTSLIKIMQMNIRKVKNIQKKLGLTDKEMAEGMGLASREYFNRVMNRHEAFSEAFQERVRRAFPEFFLTSTIQKRQPEIISQKTYDEVSA